MKIKPEVIYPKDKRKQLIAKRCNPVANNFILSGGRSNFQEMRSSKTLLEEMLLSNFEKL